MTNKKKRLIAVALVIWILGLIYLGSKSLDEFRSGKKPFNGDDTLTFMKNIIFPSLKSRDQE
jgi:hypothetical protein